MIARRIARGDLVRPTARHWKDLLNYLCKRENAPPDPPLCIVVFGDVGDGVICHIGTRGPNYVSMDSSALYDRVEDSIDYQTSREGKKHVLACGLLELAAIESRVVGDFETATWLDEQAHQVAAGNYSGCRYLLRKVWQDISDQLA